MVAQDRDQHDVGGGRHRPQQGQAVAAVAERHRAPVEENTVVREEGRTAGGRRGNLGVNSSKKKKESEIQTLANVGKLYLFFCSI